MWILDILKSNSDAFAAVESVVTTAAIFVGGFWTYRLFVKNRRKFPKLVLKHHVGFWEVKDSNYRLVRVTVTIQNEGDVLVRIKEGFNSIYQMQPWPNQLLKALSAETPCPNNGKDEYAWPTIEKRPFSLPTAIQLEPGEPDDLVNDFFIDKCFTQVLVHSHVDNAAMKGLGWRISTVVNFDQEDKKQNDSALSIQSGKDKQPRSAPKSVEKALPTHVREDQLLQTKQLP